METQAKTFILTNTKTWSRQVRVFVMNKNKKYEERLLPFTTEKIVNNKLRNERGRTIPAEYTTDDPTILAALFRDSAYGKDFTLKGDEEGTLKEPTIVIDENDRQIVALRGLFKIAGIPMDETLPFDVLKEQYEFHMTAMAGKKTEHSITIPHTPIDVKASIQQEVIAARQKYEDLYGDPVPAIVENDLAFLDGLSNPAFDAQAYIEAKLNPPVVIEDPEEEKVNRSLNEKESLHAKYFAKFKKNVPIPKGNDFAWIKAKLEEPVKE